jgi:hypothetical protein
MKRKIGRKLRTFMIPAEFQISKEPIVSPAADERSNEFGREVGLKREHGARILFAMARDPRTIFTSWNIDWVCLFEKVTPIDRQVYLRLYGAEGLEKTVAVEPMAAMHYVTTSGLHASYHVEIGYYQPADVWHSVATSDGITMPPEGIAQSADVSVATIPFHVAFQQLLDLFRVPSEAGLAVVISQFEKHVLSSEAPKFVSAKDKKILRELGISASAIEAMRRAFDQSEAETLLRRTGALLGFGASSPSRGFADTSWS